MSINRQINIYARQVQETESESVTHWTQWRRKKNPQWWRLSSFNCTSHISTQLAYTQPSINLKLDSGELTFNRSCWNAQLTSSSNSHSNNIWMTFLFICWESCCMMMVTAATCCLFFFFALMLLMQTNMSLFQLEERERN